MKKHMLMTVTSLILATSLDASEGMREEYRFRPAFQKKLKRIKPMKMGSFKSDGLRLKSNKKTVFIDWQKLYWGKLFDLIYDEGESYGDDDPEIAGIKVESASSLDTEDSQAFAKELRQELKSFAKQYGLKIVWKKKSRDVADRTAAFLEYWERGFSQESKRDVLSYAELCALSVKDTSVRDTSPKCPGAKKVSFDIVPFTNVFFKKGA